MNRYTSQVSALGMEDMLGELVQRGPCPSPGIPWIQDEVCTLGLGSCSPLWLLSSRALHLPATQVCWSQSHIHVDYVSLRI